jgi:hypothetical protein
MNSSVLIQKNVIDFSLLAMTIPLSYKQLNLSFTTAVKGAELTGARCWASADHAPHASHLQGMLSSASGDSA